MPTVTLPSPSTRAHSWDFRNFRSPGISLIVDSALVRASGEGTASVAKPGAAAASAAGRNGSECLAVAHERDPDHPHRHLAAADVHPHAGGDLAGRHARERDRLAERGRERARQDLALAVG